VVNCSFLNEQLEQRDSREEHWTTGAERSTWSPGRPPAWCLPAAVPPPPAPPGRPPPPLYRAAWTSAAAPAPPGRPPPPDHHSPAPPGRPAAAPATSTRQVRSRAAWSSRRRTCAEPYLLPLSAKPSTRSGICGGVRPAGRSEAGG
jgi:hypothetical protein